MANILQVREAPPTYEAAMGIEVKFIASNPTLNLFLKSVLVLGNHEVDHGDWQDTDYVEILEGVGVELVIMLQVSIWKVLF